MSFILVSIVNSPFLPAQAGANVVAVVGMENSGGDPRQDYLAGIIEGLLLFDLSAQSGLSLVERKNLDRVLDEQTLRLSAVAQDGAAALRVGKVLGANWLLAGQYAFAGREVMVTLKLTSVETAQTIVVQERGATEHVVHRAAEKVVAKLTGKSIVLADESNNRSILSMRDETPGVIALHSPLHAAEILLDNEFIGYTQGNMQTPILIEGLAPGKHTVQTRLGNDFGVIKLPEVEFRHWEATVDVKPGRRHAIRDETRHFNDFLYKLESLVYEQREAAADGVAALAAVHELSFVDRKGIKVPLRLELTPSKAADRLAVAAALEIAGERKLLKLALPAGPDAPAELEAVLGLVRFKASLEEHGAGRYSLKYSLARTDVYQNMFREKR